MDDNMVKCKFTTADSKVPRLIRFIKENNPNEKQGDMAPDILSSKLSTGSDEYIKWVKAQVTEKKSKKKVVKEEDEEE